MIKNIKAFLILALLVLAISKSVWSQKLISDSLFLDLKFAIQDTGQLPVKIDSVCDLRNLENPRQIGVEEKTHYGIVPVDLYILALKPLDEIIQSAFPAAAPKKDNPLVLGLKQFELKNRSQSFFFKKYEIYALVELLDETDDDSLISIGELAYSTSKTDFFFKTKLKNGYENVFKSWSLEFIDNLKDVSEYLAQEKKEPPYNFRISRPNLPWIQLLSGVDFTLLPNAFLVDGYLTFTYPEVKRLFQKSAGSIRFRREKIFDSIEYGIINGAMNYRLSSKYLLSFKYDLFLGINRWKDMQSKKHKIYDALIGDMSFGQSFLFHPIHCKTLFMGLGFFENMYYIYSKGFQFKPGIKLTAGFQL